MFLFNRNSEYDHLDADSYNQQYYTPRADHVLVDVRTAEEFSGGHLPGAVNIPLQQLARRVQEIPTGKPVVVVCATGNRSQTASSILVKSGYGEVYNLRGGTMAWMMRRLPLEV
jgi:rhodanese-related sulfurtransferase